MDHAAAGGAQGSLLLALAGNGLEDATFQGWVCEVFVENCFSAWDETFSRWPRPWPCVGHYHIKRPIKQRKTENHWRRWQHRCLKGEVLDINAVCVCACARAFMCVCECMCVLPPYCIIGIKTGPSVWNLKFSQPTDWFGGAHQLQMCAELQNGFLTRVGNLVILTTW